jgi:uncharacterized protein
MIDRKFLEKIAKQLGVGVDKAAAAVDLFDHGATVPFVEHYRKDAHGGLPGRALERIQALNAHYTSVCNRRDAIIENLTSQQQLTDALKEELLAADSMVELEDLYMPFKRQRRTKGGIAVQHGLSSLAEFLWEQMPVDKTIEDFAATYVNMESGVTSPEAALDGACHILAERIASDTTVRKALRKRMREEGLLTAKGSKLADENAAAGKHFAPYFDFAKPLAKATPEQVLTVLRGGRQGFLRIDLVIDDNAAVDAIVGGVLKEKGTPFAPYISHISGDAYRRLLRPTLEEEVLQEAREAAEEQVLDTCRDHFLHLLMTPPAGKVMTVGVVQDSKPGYKLAVLDKEGRFVEQASINFEGSQEQQLAARDVLKLVFEKHPIEALAICGGPGSREFSKFIAEARKKISSLRAFTVFVSEAGVSAFAASKEGKEEFPDLDPPVRAAITVARRFQDPLAEYVKLDPRTLGLGGLAHDVTQKRLKDDLARITELCVNAVGVDVNTASADIIRYVSGIQLGTAQNIVTHRTQHGAFKTREQLREVSGIGDKTFDQCAGFLLVRGGDEPLDTTRIHPEAYDLTRTACVEVRDVIRNEPRIRAIGWAALATDKFGALYLDDIQKELSFPAREMRRRFRLPLRPQGIETVEQIEDGMITEGIITNVTDFGAFVDIGVHQDGLIHLSELANRYVRNPREVVLLGETVRVKVLGFDKAKNRISLSRKAVPQDFRRRPAEEGEGAPRGPRRPEGEGGRDRAFAGGGAGGQRSGAQTGGQGGHRAGGGAGAASGARAQQFNRGGGGAPSGAPGGPRPDRPRNDRPRDDANRGGARKPARPARAEGPMSFGGDGQMGTSLADQLASLKEKLQG